MYTQLNILSFGASADTTRISLTHMKATEQCQHFCSNFAKGRLYESWARYHVIVHLGVNVSSSTHNCGCVVDGGNAMAAI